MIFNDMVNGILSLRTPPYIEPEGAEKTDLESHLARLEHRTTSDPLPQGRSSRKSQRPTRPT